MAKFKFGKSAGETRGILANSVFYCFITFIVIIIFRFIYPDFDDSVRLLDIFWFKARLSWGILTYINMFPAIFMSSLTLPFALKIYAKTIERRFQTAFFDFLKPSLLYCVAGTVIYTILFFIAQPLLSNYQINIQSESRLYSAARFKAMEFVEKGRWLEAANFLVLCERIWPGNPAITELQGDVETEVERLRYGREIKTRNYDQARVWALPEQRTPLNEAEALSFAKQALTEGRYYDAHWLANVAEQLARPGSTESAEAVRTASLAWNAISRMTPNPQEEFLFSIYKQKHEGYEALVNGEAIRAYYIFKSLMDTIPLDIDVQKYYAMSEQALLSVAFFLDEMDLAIGEVQTDVVFSLPMKENKQGRFVLRIGALTTFEDAAFGRSVEVLGFSEKKELLFRVSSEFVKIIPISINGAWNTIMLLRAVDRNNPEIIAEPIWSGGSSKEGQILLSMPYEEFLLAAAASVGVEGFFFSDLWRASKILSADGYATEIFCMEIIRSIFEAAYFLPFAVLALIIGWKYRTKLHVRYALYPMMLVLPLVFDLFVSLMRSVFTSIAIWSVISYGTGTSLFIVIASSVVFFALSLFILAAQRSDAGIK